MPLPSLNISAVAMTTLQKAVDVVANNIANVNTTAYKSSRIYFSQEASNIITSGSAPAGNFAGTNPIEIGTGIKVSDVSTSFTKESGPMKNTGMATDLAIGGSGTAFFVVSSQTPQDSAGLVAPQYTRDGHFMIDSNENLANASGDKVMGAMLYDDTTGKIRTLSGYSGVTFFADQAIGTIQPTVGALAPSPDLTGNVGGTPPVFDSSKIAEMSVRGNLINSNINVNVTGKGDLTVSKNSEDRMVFTYEELASVPSVTYSLAVDTNSKIEDNVLTFELADTSGNGNKIQLRIRLEPGVQSLTDVFQNVDYENGSSDSIKFLAAQAQSGSSITVGDADFAHMSISDLRSLMSPVKIPSFFYTQDTSLEIERKEFNIEANGSVSARGKSGERINLGRVLIANFINPDALMNRGQNKYDESSNSGSAAISVVGGPFDKSAPSISDVQIVSGALEQSNVNLANEFAELIGFQRSLQASSRVITASDEILQTLINL